MSKYTFSDLYDGQKVLIIRSVHAGQIAEVVSLSVTKIGRKYYTQYNLRLANSGKLIRIKNGTILQPIQSEAARKVVA